MEAKNMNAQELMKEARNAAGDPADYFDYIMFAWGNCPVKCLDSVEIHLEKLIELAI